MECFSKKLELLANTSSLEFIRSSAATSDYLMKTLDQGFHNAIWIFLVWGGVSIDSISITQSFHKLIASVFVQSMHSMREAQWKLHVEALP